MDENIFSLQHFLSPLNEMWKKAPFFKKTLSLYISLKSFKSSYVIGLRMCFFPFLFLCLCKLSTSDSLASKLVRTVTLICTSDCSSWMSFETLAPFRVHYKICKNIVLSVLSRSWRPSSKGWPQLLRLHTIFILENQWNRTINSFSSFR